MEVKEIQTGRDHHEEKLPEQKETETLVGREETIPVKEAFLSVESPIGSLLNNAAVKAALQKFLPEGTVEMMEENPMVRNFSLKKLSGYKPDPLFIT